MVIGTVVIGQLVVDMFKQVFIELIQRLSWRVHLVNYYLKIFQDFLIVFDFTYSDSLMQGPSNTTNCLLRLLNTEVACFGRFRKRFFRGGGVALPRPDGAARRPCQNK